MSNIRKRNGKFFATYKDVEYEFNTFIELMIAISTIKANLPKETKTYRR